MDIKRQSGLYNRLESSAGGEIHNQITENTPLSSKGFLANECLAGYLFADKVLSQIANDSVAQSSIDSKFNFYHETSEKLGPLNSKGLPKNIFNLDAEDKRIIIQSAINEGVIPSNKYAINLKDADNKTLDKLTLIVCREIKSIMPLATKALSDEIKGFKEIKPIGRRPSHTFNFS